MTHRADVNMYEQRIRFDSVEVDIVVIITDERAT